MKSTLAERTLLRTSLFQRYSGALLALSIAWSGFDASATPDQARGAINAKLAAFRTDFNTDPEPDQTGAKPNSFISAKAPDLLLAIAAALEDPANAAISGSDFAAAVLLAGDGTVAGIADTGKLRSDRDKIIASVIDQIIQSRQLAGNSGAIAAILNGALSDAKTPANPSNLGLTAAGQAAAIGQALKSATDPNAGLSMAAEVKVKDVVNQQGTDTNKLKLIGTAILNANSGTGANSGNVRSFLNGLMDNGVLTTTSQAGINSNLITLAKLVKKYNSAVGETIGAAADRTNNLGEIENVATQAIGALKAAASEITGAVAAKYKLAGGSVITLANTLKNNQDKSTTARIAGGAIKAADAGDVGTIYTNLAPTAAADVITFASLAAIGNDDSKVATITGLAKNTAGIDKTKLGAAIVAAISLTNPNAADSVGSTLGADAAFNTAALKATLAGNLAKAAKSAGAAGAVATGVASTANTGTQAQIDTDRTNIAIAANKAASKFISSISMGIGASFVVTPNVLDAVNSARLTKFAADLTTANTGKATDIAVGVSMANPIYADQVVDKVVFLTGAATGKTKGSVAKVVQAVGTAVDVEEVAEIVTQVATHFTIDGKAAGTVNTDNALKASNATAIAAAAANAIQLKAGVKTSNRTDELGESAASLVGQIINSYKNGNLVFKAASASADLAKLISGVTSSIIKTLSKTELVDTLTQKADLTAAANIAADVANTIFQAQTVLGLSATDFNAIKAQLLKDIPKLGGKGYGDYKIGTVLTDGLITIGLKAGFLGDNTRFESGVRNAATDVSQDPGITPYTTNPSTLTPGTKTGSVIDPETDSRPG
jgi:hypothetical protein